MCKTQMKMCYEAMYGANKEYVAFMEAINDPINPLTNQDLINLIALRPTKYKKFEHFIGKLSH